MKARRAVVEAAILLLLALAPAGAALWYHVLRPGSAEPGVVDAAGVAGWREPFLWVDARSAAEFDKWSLPGAVRLTEAEWEDLFDGFLDAWEPGLRVVVVCEGSACTASRAVARRLRQELGFPHIYYLLGGIESWR